MLICNGKDLIKELLKQKTGDSFLRILKQIIRKNNSKMNINIKLISKYEFLIFTDSDNSSNIKFNFDDITEKYNTIIKVNVMNPNVEKVLNIKNKKDYWNQEKIKFSKLQIKAIEKCWDVILEQK